MYWHRRWIVGHSNGMPLKTPTLCQRLRSHPNGPDVNRDANGNGPSRFELLLWGCALGASDCSTSPLKYCSDSDPVSNMSGGWQRVVPAHSKMYPRFSMYIPSLSPYLFVPYRSLCIPFSTSTWQHLLHK